MFRIFAIGIDVLSAAIILVPAFILLNITLFHEKCRSRQLLYMLFALYLSAIFSATGIPSIASPTVDPSFNLIPVIDIANSPFEYLKNTLLNILLFVPLGFFLPLLWKEFQSLKRTVLCGLCLSLGIEILQIFTFRLTDIDDLITNTLGTLFGFFAAGLFLHITDGNFNKKDKKSEQELMLIICLVFLVCFMVSPFISDHIWALICNTENKR